jgi:hypothetical protein
VAALAASAPPVVRVDPFLSTRAHVPAPGGNRAPDHDDHHDQGRDRNTARDQMNDVIVLGEREDQQRDEPEKDRHPPAGQPADPFRAQNRWLGLPGEMLRSQSRILAPLIERPAHVLLTIDAAGSELLLRNAEHLLEPGASIGLGDIVRANIFIHADQYRQTTARSTNPRSRQSVGSRDQQQPWFVRGGRWRRGAGS